MLLELFFDVRNEDPTSLPKIKLFYYDLVAEAFNSVGEELNFLKLVEWSHCVLFNSESNDTILKSIQSLVTKL